MKIDRLLAIVFFLLNRELVSCRELAEKFEVSLRTIQRDMDSLCQAGIPILSVQGAQGGFGIMQSYKLDRQLVNVDDLFFILTALESIGATYKGKNIQETIEKVKNLTRQGHSEEFEKRRRKLHIDFSALNIGPGSANLFTTIEEAIDKKICVGFRYTGGKLRLDERIVEPHTLAFKWHSWYLFAWCRHRSQFRMFRLSRIKDLELTDQKFSPRQADLDKYYKEQHSLHHDKFIDIRLKFDPDMQYVVEDYFKYAKISRDEQGSYIVDFKMPDGDWVAGMILSYQDKVELVSPTHLRKKIIEKLKDIEKKYSAPN